LVNRFQQAWTICSLSQRFTGYQAAYDRITPAHFVVLVNVKLRGGEGAALGGNVFRERGAQMDEPLLRELFEFHSVQHQPMLPRSTLSRTTI
jgi:hypothetical protein